MGILTKIEQEFLAREGALHKLAHKRLPEDGFIYIFYCFPCGFAPAGGLVAHVIKSLLGLEFH